MLIRILLCACVLLTPAVMLLFTGFFVQRMPEGTAEDGKTAGTREKSPQKGRVQRPFSRKWKRSAAALLFLSFAGMLFFPGGDGTGLAIMGILLCIVQSIALLLLFFTWKQGGGPDGQKKT